MKLLNMICVILFFVLFLIWAFVKIRNIVLVKKLNCKKFYKSIKKDFKNQKISKNLFKAIIVCAIIIGMYFVILISTAFFSIVMFFITLGGAAYIDTNSDSTFFENLNKFVVNWFNSISYVFYFICLMLYIILIREIYINIQIYKKLTSEDIKNIQLYENSISSSKNISNIKRNLIFILSLFAILICILALKGFELIKDREFDFIDVVFPVMNSSAQMTPNWYFFSNDRLYGYEYSITGDELYSTDLYAHNKKVISNSEDLRYANIFMVYNDEMFYYTPFKHGIKKINLKTGKINNVIDDKYLCLIPDTLKNGKVLANYVERSHAYFATLDLETRSLSNEKDFNLTTQQPYFYDDENEKIYYIDSSNDKNILYENNEVIYTYSKTNSKDNNHDLVFYQDNYIFAIISNKIIKFDASNYSIVDEKELDKNFSLISSVRNSSFEIERSPAITSIAPLFTIADDSNTNCNDIYNFNSSTFSFEKIVENNNYIDFMQKYDNYFVLQSSDKTIIYNYLNKKYKIYNSTNYTLENGYIYLMTYTGDLYRQKEDDLEFKVKKLLIKDILK